MYVTKVKHSSSLLKQGLFALVLMSLVMLLPEIASATSETGAEVESSVVENIVKYGKWIAFAVIGVAFIMVGWFCLRAYASWADDDNKQGTMPRLVLTIFFGILILAVVTIFVTKGATYLEENLTTSTTSITPVSDVEVA